MSESWDYLCCEFCDEERSTSRGLYWHLRRDHKQSHERAFEMVGEAMVGRNVRKRDSERLRHKDRSFMQKGG